MESVANKEAREKIVSDTYILGISAYYHDSAAVLLKNGYIVAAASEERFTRVKGDASFPHNAVGFCLQEGGIILDEVDFIVFYEDSVLKFDRLLTMTYVTAPRGLRFYLAAMPKWLTNNLWINKVIAKELNTKKKIYNCQHHMAHAASAFYPSPYEKAAILTIDGVGEWATTTYGIGNGNKIKLIGESRFPNSLGLLYSAFTYYTGFKINFGEYKLMGLAPYGKPIYVDLIKEKLVHINDDGTIILNQKYFSYTTSLNTINEDFENLFGKPSRKPESKITRHEMDIAASIQLVTNEIVLKMAKFVKSQTGADYLVMAGGVALNVVSMGVVEREAGYKGIWIQPAAGDAGGALGAAQWLWYDYLGNKRCVNRYDSMRGSFLGYRIDNENDDDDAVLLRMGAKWENLDEKVIEARVASLLAQNKIIGIARGEMEWGPRALGHRSIIGSAMDERMQSRMNLKIKFRESFRPFAPMVLREDAKKYFIMDGESPYMLKTYFVQDKRRNKDPNIAESTDDVLELINQKRSDIPAVTHLDYSARVQTVDSVRNPFMYEVLKKYKDISGCSVIVNTSFNVRGEPIVCTAEDAYRCFMATEMDYLVIGNRLFDKEEQNNKAFDDETRDKWLRRFDLD